MTLEKEQLMQCIQDLANRAVEVKANSIAVTLYTLYAAGMTETDGALADWNRAFAVAQLKIMTEEKEKRAKEKLDKPETPDNP